MPELRWILTVFGLLLLIGIYAWGRRSSKAASPADEPLVRARPDPTFEPRVVYETADFDASEPAGYVDEEVQREDEPIAQPAPSVPVREPTRARVVAESHEDTIEAPVRSTREPRYSRVEPTFGEDSVTAELPVRDVAPDAAVQEQPPSEAPTISMSSTPQPRRSERRKIIALRLAAGPQRLSGADLKVLLESESLQHGKYDVFHRLDDNGASIFSIASMVEPGTFNLENMPAETYPGITMFTQLPGPVAGLFAFNELVACGRRLNAELGGTLQDERGVPLTMHRVERIRQEIREFEQRPAGDSQQRPGSSYSPTPQ